MPLYHPPASVVRELKAYDPDLRVRWSDYRDQWIIERKMRRGKFDFYAADPDTQVQVREGYILICRLPYNWLDGRVLKALQVADMWKHGGAKGVNQRLDDYHYYKYQKDDLEQKETLRHLANEMFTFLQHRKT